MIFIVFWWKLWGWKWRRRRVTVLQHSRSGRKGTVTDLSASSENSQIHCRTTAGRGLIVNTWRTWMLLATRTALFTHGCVRKLECFWPSEWHIKYSLYSKKAAAIAHLRNANSIWIKSPQYCYWTGLKCIILLWPSWPRWGGTAPHWSRG